MSGVLKRPQLGGRVVAPAACPDLLRLCRPDSAKHFVQFYENDPLLIESVAYVAAKALEAGDSTVLVATDSHLKAIEARLADSAGARSWLRESGRYVALDASETLSRIMVDGWPDEVKFNEIVGGTIRGATRKGVNGFVFAFGEMVGLLCAANNPKAAVRLERLWNLLAARYRFSLYCGYPLSSLGTDPDMNAVLQICAEHDLTIPAETSF
ncbi:MAG TPA: MEDS domain-containing protein [Candidatus Binataceae bacterium]|nr:MEDS domain-containing protein [Candidatus Binataceae bacterium]